MEKQLKPVRINGVEYYKEPVNFYIEENNFKANDDTFYMGKLTLLNPDKTSTDMSNGQTSDLVKTGEWVPKLKVAGDTATHRITLYRATYTKIGDLCYITAYIRGINTIGTPAGSLDITGLPFPVMFSDSLNIGIFRGSNLTVDRFKNLRANTVASDIIQLRPIDTVVDTFTDITFNNGLIQISGCYKINTEALNNQEPQK